MQYELSMNKKLQLKFAGDGGCHVIVAEIRGIGCGWFIGECDAIKPAASSLGLQ